MRNSRLTSGFSGPSRVRSATTVVGARVAIAAAVAEAGAATVVVAAAVAAVDAAERCTASVRSGRLADYPA